MCGFAGVAGDLPGRRARVEAMTRAIAHRGRDGHGLWEDERVTLGHRRLAILDLSPAGAQPMVSDDGSVVIAYNGEVYDFAKHRSDLERRGVTFRSRTDTEVLLALYRIHGAGFASRVEGMFAFAIWDRREQRLVLTRDRFGQKPLYTARLGREAVAFASDIGALLALPEVSRDADPQAIDDLLTLQMIPAPRTAFASIRRMPRATVATWSPDGRIDERPLDIPARPVRKGRAFEDSVHEADHAIRAAVRRTLVSDVPVGLFLSGGVDSSLIASYVAEEGHGPAEAFTATFAGPTDELAFAKLVSQRLGLRLHPVEVKASDFSDPERLVDMFHEPFADVAALPTALLAARAKPTMSVALCGDGGDEVFGGYAHHVAARWLGVASPVLGTRAAAAMRDVAGALLRSTSHPSEDRRLRRVARRALEIIATPDARGASLRLRGSADATIRSQLYRSELIATLAGRDPYAAIAPRGGLAGVDDLFDPDCDAVLPDLFLRKTDVATMSATLEARAPLLDRAVVEVGRSMPLAHLVQRGRGKRVLRALLARRLGRDLAERPKTGFSPPVSQWLRRELAGVFREVVLARDARVSAFLQPRLLSSLFSEHLERRADHRRMLWSVLLLELWLRRWS